MNERTYFKFTAIKKKLTFNLKKCVAHVMPKSNSTAAAAAIPSSEVNSNLQQQEAGLVINSSNLNLNSKMVEMSAVTTTTSNKDAHKSKRKKHLDDECDSIGDLIGHYGKWQFVMTLLLSLFQVPNTFHIFSPTFQVRLSIFIC